MRQVVGFGIGPRKGVLLGANLGRAIVTNGDFTAYVCDSAATRPSSQITLGRLVQPVSNIIIAVERMSGILIHSVGRKFAVGPFCTNNSELL